MDKAIKYFEEGCLLRGSSKEREAIAQFDKSIAIDSKFIEAYMGRAAAHTAIAEYDNAIADYEIVLGIDNLHMDARFNKAIMYTKLQLFSEAMSDFSDVIVHYPDSHDAYFARGMCYWKLEQLDKAGTDFEYAIKLDDTNIEYYIQNATLLGIQERYNESFKNLAKAIQIDPENNFVKGLMAAFIKPVESDISTNQYNAGECHNLGVLFMHMENYDTALRYFNQSLSLNPESVYTYLEKASIFEKLGNLEEAKECCNMALQIDQENSDALDMSAKIFLLMKNYHYALQDINSAIRINPLTGHLYVNRANIYICLAQLEKAIADCDMAISLIPDNLDAYLNKGNALFTMDKFEECLECFETVLAKDQYYAVAYEGRGNYYYAMKKYDKATDNYERAIAIAPNSFFPWGGKGNVMFAQGNFTGAFSCYSKALELNPNFGMGYMNRAICCENLKMYDKAIADSLMAIRVEPRWAAAPDPYSILAFSYLGLNQNYDAHIYCNTYLYYAVKTGKIKYLKRILEIFEASPWNVKTILDSFNIDLSELIYDTFGQSLDDLSDFTLLLDYFEAVHETEARELYSIKAILGYYLGGPVRAYMIFDEILDDGSPLLAHELYYFAIAAAAVNIEKEVILSNCINELEKSKTTDLDEYYLGQLYLMNNESSKAAVCFKNSKSCIWSLIMLAGLSAEKQEKDLYVKMAEEKAIDVLLDFDTKIKHNGGLGQFTTYFHMTECSKMISALRLQYELPFIPAANPGFFWQIFQLNHENRESLLSELRKIEILKVLEELKNSFADGLMKNTPPDVPGAVLKTNYLLSETSSKVSDRFNSLNSRITSGNDPANQIGLEIEGWTVDSPDFYNHLIKYYFLTETINPEETFSLFMYLLKKYLQRKESGLNKGSQEVFLSVAGAAFSIVGKLVKVKNAADLLIKQFNNNPEFKFNEISDYHSFQQEIWLFIATEQTSLTSDAFARKYKLFTWFDSYKF